MHHPNIAKVLGAGATDSGRPDFVMELVKGIPLVEFCDSNNLGAHERLELFVTICRAVQHAHHKGVIHRDLKSSNVMVTLIDNSGRRLGNSCFVRIKLSTMTSAWSLTFAYVLPSLLNV